MINEYGPSVLIGGGVLSLLATHAGPPLYKMWKQDDLEIVYDPADEQGRFGGVGQWRRYKDEDEPEM